MDPLPGTGVMATVLYRQMIPGRNLLFSPPLRPCSSEPESNQSPANVFGMKHPAGCHRFFLFGLVRFARELLDRTANLNCHPRGVTPKGP